MGTQESSNDEFDDRIDFNARFHFLEWQANPFDHQMRSQDFCNAVLDSHPYNGHTTAQDALYGGVPIVTRSDGQDMSSRVTTSGNIVLGLGELNANAGSKEYEDIAIRLGNDDNYYQKIRSRLIASCLQKNPMHPYWDIPRYVKNFENGLKIAWETFLSGKEKSHIEVFEDEQTKKGSFERDIKEMDKRKMVLKQKRDELVSNSKIEL